MSVILVLALRKALLTEAEHTAYLSSHQSKSISLNITPELFSESTTKKDCKNIAVLMSCFKVFQWRIYIVKFWTRAPPGVQILSISCSFWENLAKSYVGAPPGELAPPPRGNPGSATVFLSYFSIFQIKHSQLVT